MMHPQLTIGWLLQLLMTGLIFGSLCWGIRYSPQFSLVEERLQHRIIRQQNNWWWQLVATVFDPKTLVMWDFLLAGLLVVQGRSLRAMYVLVMLASVDAFGIWIKHHLKRQRPATFGKSTPTYSFPSGHTLGTTMMTLMIGMLFPNLLIRSLVLLGWLLVIGCRLTLHAHYPSDVLGAVVLAYGWWIGGELLYILITR